GRDRPVDPEEARPAAQDRRRDEEGDDGEIDEEDRALQPDRGPRVAVVEEPQAGAEPCEPVQFLLFGRRSVQQASPVHEPGSSGSRATLYCRVPRAYIAVAGTTRPSGKMRGTARWSGVRSWHG